MVNCCRISLAYLLRKTGGARARTNKPSAMLHLARQNYENSTVQARGLLVGAQYLSTTYHVVRVTPVTRFLLLIN